MSETHTEAVGVFFEPKAFEEAIDELLSSGFDRAEISILASERAVEEKLGHAYEKVSELEDDPATPRTAYVSTESIADAKGALMGSLLYVGALAGIGAVVASGGTVASAIAAAAVAGGLGGVIGSDLAKLVGDRHGKKLQRHLSRGGLLLWVRTWDDERERRAMTILSKHSAHDVHIHALSGMSG